VFLTAGSNSRLQAAHLVTFVLAFDIESEQSVTVAALDRQDSQVGKRDYDLPVRGS
jgi:hypothetical protein